MGVTGKGSSVIYSGNMPPSNQTVVGGGGTTPLPHIQLGSTTLPSSKRGKASAATSISPKKKSSAQDVNTPLQHNAQLISPFKPTTTHLQNSDFTGTLSSNGMPAKFNPTT